jgi:hypothetical protein
MSEAGAARLINANPPRWAKKLPAKMKHPPLEMPEETMSELMKAHPGHPPLEEWLTKTFSSSGGLRADKIKGPAKLYRIVDPSNEGAGIFWMTEEEFKALRNRDEWREKFAVKPDWNQNGSFVEYEIQEGESLAVWRGPAASQELAGTDRYLEGGGEQIVFFPEKRDEMVRPLARVDKTTGRELTDRSGNLDRRVEFTDVTGQAAPAKLRARIVDPHIKGPTSTGWGAADFTEQEAQRILLTVPTSK